MKICVLYKTVLHEEKFSVQSVFQTICPIYLYRTVSLEWHMKYYLEHFSEELSEVKNATYF
jgi:hypothetical protein